MRTGNEINFKIKKKKKQPKTKCTVKQNILKEIEKYIMYDLKNQSMAPRNMALHTMDSTYIPQFVQQHN